MHKSHFRNGHMSLEEHIRELRHFFEKTQGLDCQHLKLMGG